MKRAERIFLSFLIATLIMLSYVHGIGGAEDVPQTDIHGSGFNTTAMVLFVVSLLVSLRLTKKYSVFIKRYR